MQRQTRTEPLCLILSLIMVLSLFCSGIAFGATIWPATAVPKVVADYDGQPLEVGVKFRSDVNGTITGLRFYKGAANTGTHVANLWTSTGTRLATATFSGESASGWQQVSFTTPVAISANTTYVASYYSPTGYFAVDFSYFLSGGMDNAPLHALANGVDGGNGVYRYGASGFPNQTYSGNNYWVDVVFNPAGSGDTTPPVVTAFTVPSSASSLTVPITSFTATDNTAVTGYLVTETSAAPSPTASGWSATAPSSYTVTSAGSKTLYAWAKDAAGNVSAARSAAVTITLADTTPPVVTAFTVPSSASSLTVNITSFTATDNIAVTGYLVTETSSAPSPTASGWTAAAPSSYTFASAGSKTLYAWAKDAAGNVSAARSAAVTITLSDTTPPVVTAFTVPSSASSLTVAITSFTATDNTAVTGYLVTETSAAPSPTASGWSATAPASYTCASAGSKTLYAWARDAAGNVSAARSAAVTITLADTTLPVVTAFTIPSSASSLTVAITSFTATDNIAVTGFLVTETSTAPSPTATGWSATAPASYTVASAGSKTLYAWAKDAAGNVSAAKSATVTITIASARSTIWPATVVPKVAADSDGQPLEIGVKFRSDVNGIVTGLRFYKGAANTGTHVANLWTSAGTRLTTATFSGESASGWQEVTFTTPVAISANTTYVASYYSPTGYFAVDLSYFLSGGVDNAPLHALANGVDGGNGVYKYGTSGFPTQTYSGNNYWVDVVFSPAASGDTTPPVVTAFTVPSSASSLTVNITSFTATDNIAVTGYLVTETSSAPSPTASGWTAAAPSSYTFASAGSKTLYAWAKDAAGNVSAARSASVTITLADTTAPVVTVFTVPSSASSLTVPITSFTATDNIAVTGYLVTETSAAPSPTASGWSAAAPASYTCASAGSKTLYAWARDAAGNVSAAKSAAVTITLAANSPILLVSSASNPFSRYYEEVLRTEGLNAFDRRDIGAVSSGLLANYDIVLLGEFPLSASQATMLSDWVNAGGRLVAMRPDSKLAGLLGLTDLGSTLADRYLLVNTSSGPGTGIVGQTIQYHGNANLYGLNGATSLATLYSDAGTATTNPAVTLRSVGANGGKAAAFAYDLARSVAYTRQGNPAWSGQERDGSFPIRTNDLFYGNASFDPQPDWIDLNKVAIPQADEQQRLLANLIIQMNQDKKPLPRFWYFPRNLKAVVVMTGDDHGWGTAGTAGRFDRFNTISPSGCSVDNWECIRGTSYVFPVDAVQLSDAQAVAYNAAGFEVALHVNSGNYLSWDPNVSCDNFTPSSFETTVATQLVAFQQKFPSLVAPVSNRNHCVTWSDYTSAASVELNHSIRLDTSYYYWPPDWAANRPGLFTGSGMPMRFAQADGTLIDVYQATTQMTDESGQSYPATIDALLDRALGDEGYYGAFVANMHDDDGYSQGADAIVNSAMAHSIPVVSARQMLRWLDGRNGSSFSGFSWNGSTLAFSVSAGQGANGLVAMVPLSSGQAVTRVTGNGSSLTFETVTIKGVRYVRFPVSGGTYQIFF